jgi:hypothetical protein
MQPSVGTTPDAPIGLGGEGNEANVPSSAVTLCDVPTSSRIDCGFFEWVDEVKRNPNPTSEDDEQYEDICRNYEVERNTRRKNRGEDLIWRTRM